MKKTRLLHQRKRRMSVIRKAKLSETFHCRRRIKVNNEIKRDIELCRNCMFFHEENDPFIEGEKGFHWGVGYRCGAVAFGSPWSKESHHALPEEEFVRANILFTPGKHRCFQNSDKWEMNKIVWNKDDVYLTTFLKPKEYRFENFTGNISFYGYRCKVKNAAFTVVVHDLYGLDEMILSEKNYIVWENGEVTEGDLFCKEWKDGIFNGNKLIVVSVYEKHRHKGPFHAG